MRPTIYTVICDDDCRVFRKRLCNKQSFYKMSNRHVRQSCCLVEDCFKYLSVPVKILRPISYFSIFEGTSDIDLLLDP